jgi:hypothetical protein
METSQARAGRAPWIAAGVGVLLLGTCSRPAVELWVNLLNRELDPGKVVSIMSTSWVGALVDPQSLPRQVGPWLGAALLALGLGLLGKRRWIGRAAQTPPKPNAPVARAPTPAAIPLPALTPPPDTTPAGGVDIRGSAQPAAPAWLESSPSQIGQRRRAPGPLLSGPTGSGNVTDPVRPPAPEWFDSAPSVSARGTRRTQTGPLLSQSGTMLSATVELPERYRMEDRIGAGAMGVVYRAWDQRLNRAVAIKVLNAELSLDPQTAQRFLQEARAMAALSHPNIVTLFDVGVEGETPYMVMEYLRGSHLRDVLGDLPLLPENDVLLYGAQVADALATVHQHRLVHRDVKPENILLLEGTRRVKLMDFGIAHVIQSQKAKGTRPSGTPYYMSPEQITGGELGPWTDIYGLGATLFALLTGSLPFPEGEPLYHAVHTQAPSPQEFVPSLSSGTAALILSCLEKDPRKRPQSATILATRLKSLAGLEASQEPTKS